ncbi:MAG: type IX secretion system sortase PorU [Ignavibacteria bacterium]|nr:type IX secretion system sortase PorU [Ignavibacteria bacterium]
MIIEALFKTKRTVYFILAVIFSVVPENNLFSQLKDLPVQNNIDYKIISSGESFIEIEYSPVFEGKSGFLNAADGNFPKGSPDIKVRSFPLFFPSGNISRAEITDSRYEEIQGTEISPVPVFRISDKSKNKNDKPEYVPDYIKDDKVYSSNFFFPGEAAEVKQTGVLRNRYIGFLNLYPVQYNPVTGTVKRYTYLRVKVIFGGTPVYSSKSLSNEERNFFSGITINSDIAANWSTAEFNKTGDSPVKNSVLASGDFYKIEIKESGIYRIDKNYLQSKSVNVNGIDPRTIKIYGNGGSELPYNNSVIVPDDLLENKIYVEGQEDGSFDNGDYILFYGRSPNEWIYDPALKTYKHKLHQFSASNFYWITFGGTNGQRMPSVNSPNISGLTPLASFKDRFFEEPEVNNLGATGYLWVSQRISLNGAFIFNKELKGYIAGSYVNFRFRFGNGSYYPINTIWRLEDLNSNFIINQQVLGVAGYSHVNLSYIDNNPLGVYYPLLPGRTSINFKASLPSQNGNSSNVSGYYDYYELFFDRAFTADNNQLRFNSPDTNTAVEYRINNFSSQSVKIFDCTKQEDVKLINPLSFSGSAVTFQSENIEGNPKEFYIIGDNNYKTPVSVSSKIPNQNLKGEFISGASFIIIAPKEFVPAANRLKALRETPGPDRINTVVLDIEKIYNEFSNGIQDPVAVRNFLKYAFNNWAERPVYVFFMGDGSYDYKNIYNLNGIKNWLPPLAKNSLYSDDVESYCSDDFVIEINENLNQPEPCIPDFSTGRVCINSTAEANIIVDKIAAYQDPVNFDSWKNSNMYVADDGWTTEQITGGEGNLHTYQCEEVAQNHTPKHVKKEKVYIVSYPTEITPQGRRKPGANNDIIKYWNDGKLVINYTGHGSVDLWAHEHVFVRQVSIPLLNNKNKYPFITIASCDLARWDDPYLLSAGEQLVNLQDKGAIGVVAAVRPVYASQNAIFNNLLYDNIYKKDTLNLPVRLGKALFNVKQTLYSDNDLKYALLCDPTLRLGVPQYFTRIDSINNVPGSSLFNMKALQRIKITGSVLKTDSTFWNNYNGDIDIAVYDVNKNIYINDFGFDFNYIKDGGIIYKGKTAVADGKWTINFVVPRDISYSPGRGKIISYFKNSYSDGTGYSDNFIMSGLDSTAEADSTGPEIKIYMDNRNFRSGDMLNQNPKLIADITDENGINLTGTIGHRIEAVLNDDENNKIDLTNLYVSTSGFQTGSVEYQMQNLQDGKYKLQLNAWDTYNNFSSEVIDFNVKSSDNLELENVYNYPNPMSDNTTFIFQHNFDNPITADIKIYTVSGRLIKELNKTNITDKFVNIDWDGSDTDGDAIANGTYLYKITINSNDGSYSKSSTGKLAKLK